MRVIRFAVSYSESVIISLLTINICILETPCYVKRITVKNQNPGPRFPQYKNRSIIYYQDSLVDLMLLCNGSFMVLLSVELLVNK